MGFSGFYGFCRALVNGDELDPIHAPLAGRAGNLPMGFQTAGKVIGIRRISTDGLCLFLKTGNRFGERFLFVLVFFRQVDTDLFGKLAKNLVLINRAGQPVRLGRSACGLRQLSSAFASAVFCCSLRLRNSALARFSSARTRLILERIWASTSWLRILISEYNGSYRLA